MIVTGPILPERTAGRNRPGRFPVGRGRPDFCSPDRPGVVEFTPAPPHPCPATTPYHDDPHPPRRPRRVLPPRVSDRAGRRLAGLARAGRRRHHDGNRVPDRVVADREHRLEDGHPRNRAFVPGRVERPGVRHRLPGRGRPAAGREAAAERSGRPDPAAAYSLLPRPKDRQDRLATGGRQGPARTQAQTEQLRLVDPGGRRRTGVRDVPRLPPLAASIATTSPATRSGRSRPASSTRSTGSAVRRSCTRTR